MEIRGFWPLFVSRLLLGSSGDEKRTSGAAIKNQNILSLIATAIMDFIYRKPRLYCSCVSYGDYKYRVDKWRKAKIINGSTRSRSRH